MHYGMQTLQNYHDHYLLSYVLLLADVFENFRNAIIKEHYFDCLHFVTLSSLAWALALKFTGIELELIVDQDAYLMIKNNMRGGIATISHRYAEGYDPSELTSYMTYLDSNNLYGDAMSNPLPLGKFEFLSQTEIDRFDLVSIPPDDDTGYIIECDFIYPDHLHPLHSDYLLAPNYLTINFEMFRPFATQFIDKEWKSLKQLVPNLYKKTNMSHTTEIYNFT